MNKIKIDLTKLDWEIGNKDRFLQEIRWEIKNIKFIESNEKLKQSEKYLLQEAKQYLKYYKWLLKKKYGKEV